jgi:Peptidase A4 family
MNLFQPVNPWTGSSWAFYIEYYQWSPTHNQDSKMMSIQPGDILHGVVTYNQGQNSYTAVHTNLNNGQSVTLTIPVQKDSNGNYKQYTIMYVVMEKSQWNCNQYPANGIVTFYDIDLEYNGQPVSPTWTTSYVDDNCNCRAHVGNETSINITWDTS